MQFEDKGRNPLARQVYTSPLASQSNHQGSLQAGKAFLLDSGSSGAKQKTFSFTQSGTHFEYNV